MTNATRTVRLAIALVALGGLAACGNSDASSATESGAGSATTAGGSAAFAAGGRDVRSGGAAATAAAAAATTAGAATTVAASSGTVATGGGGATPVAPPPPDRKVIVTVTLDLQVPDVASAATKVTTLVEGVGGYSASQQVALAAERPSATLVLKVPPDKVTALLQSIAGLGRVTNQTQSSDDVTAQYFDLESRIATARASVERVRAFLARTQDVSELAGLEAELTRRETELEQLIATQQGLGARAAMATVTVALLPAPPTTTTTVAPTTTTQAPLDARRALRNGTDVLGNIFGALAVALAFLLPFLPFVIVAAFVVWAVRRRSARRDAIAVPLAPPPVAEPEREREPEPV